MSNKDAEFKMPLPPTPRSPAAATKQTLPSGSSYSPLNFDKNDEMCPKDVLRTFTEFFTDSVGECETLRAEIAKLVFNISCVESFVVVHCHSIRDYILL